MHANHAVHFNQASPRRAGLQVGGDDDARDRGQVTSRGTSMGQDVGGLARGSGGGGR